MHMRIQLICMAFFCISYSVFAQDAKDIMRKVNFQASPIDEKTDFSMKLIDSKGKIRERTATQFIKRVNPNMWENSRLIRFHSPAEIAKSAVLILEKKDADYQQWIYIPSTYSIRRIPSKNRGDRYMGTDFSYEDVYTIDIDKYNFELIGDKIIDNQNCYKIEQIPKDKKLMSESIYSRILHYIDKEYFVILEAEYFDKKDVMIKRFKATQIIKTGKYFRPNHIEMEDIRLQHKTTITYGNRILEKGISDHIFSIQSLERGK